jgi:acetyltransferase
VALTAGGELAGVSRMVCDPDHRTAEYALLVRSDLKGRGLGTALMEILIDYARADGLERLDGLVLRENRGMLGLVGRIGFQSELDPEDPSVVRTWLDIGPAAALAEPAGGS